MIGDLIQDLRYALRILWLNPGVSSVAVLALALGIGANTAIFSLVDAVVLRPLAFDETDRLMLVEQVSPVKGGDNVEVAPGNFIDLRDQSRSFEQVAAWYWWDVNVSAGQEGGQGRPADTRRPGASEPVRAQGFLVTPSFFPALRMKPAMGRTFLAEEDQPGKDQVVVISHAFWRDRFASDPGVLGRTVRLNSVPHTIIGVMPEGFQFPPGGPELWGPLTLDSAQPQTRGFRFLRVIARLKPGVTRQQAEAEAGAIAARLGQAYPDTNAGWGFSVSPLVDFVVKHSRPILLSMLGAVGFVLLIACANVANLLLSRAVTRQKEIAIRLAMGASRPRVVRQLLTESVVLATLGGLAGLLLAQWGVEMLQAGIPPGVIRFVPGWEETGIGGRVLGFTLAVSVVTGILFGLVPALQASRPDLNETLKETGRQWAGGPGRHRIRGALVVAEIALTMVLLIGAALSVRGFQTLTQENLGFVPDRVITAQVTLAQADYPEPPSRTEFYRQVIERIGRLPGVEMAAATARLPLSGSSESSGVTIDGKPAQAPSERPSAERCSVTADYFRTMGIAILRGREFTSQDGQGAMPVAVISEKMSHRFWPGEDPLGKRFSIGSNAAGAGWITVVGIAADVKSFGFDPEPRPTMYLHLPQAPRSSMTLVARTSIEPTSLVAAIRAQVQEVNRGQPIYEVKTMDEEIGDAMAGAKFSMGLLGALAGVALFLASIGIYGVMSSSVAQRTHEIGVRMALGAQRADVLAMTMRHGLKLTLLGVGIGVAGAYGITRLIASAIYWIHPTDPLAFTAIPLLLASVALLATYLPAQRATQVDPMVALRHE